MSRTVRKRDILGWFGVVWCVGWMGLAMAGLIGRILPPSSGSVGWLLDTLGQWGWQAWLCGLLGFAGAAFINRSLLFSLMLLWAVIGLGLAHGVGVGSGSRHWHLPARHNGADVGVLVFNAKSTNIDIASIEQLIDESNADVAVLCELNARFVRAYYTRGRGALEHVQVRAPIPGVSAWTLVMSRWPMQRLPGTEEDPVVRVIVEAPDPFELIGIHLPSPRKPERWGLGHRLASSLEGETGLPLVIAGDLNASPLGGRDRLLRASASVSRSKPLLSWAGTFPAAGIGLTRLPIDGVWSDQHFEPVFWRTGRSVGSDHRSLLVGLGLASGVDRRAEEVDTGSTDAGDAGSE